MPEAINQVNSSLAPLEILLQLLWDQAEHHRGRKIRFCLSITEGIISNGSAFIWKEWDELQTPGRLIYIAVAGGRLCISHAAATQSIFRRKTPLEVSRFKALNDKLVPDRSFEPTCSQPHGGGGETSFV